MRWFEAAEQLPEQGKLVLGYSEVHGTYIVSQWCPARGWLNQEEKAIRIITHWLDADISFPFPILEDANEELAKRYKIKTSIYD